MKTYIALLRGINVGGHNKIPMAELRGILSELGLEHIKTYIQSGNVIFQSNKESIMTLQDIIHNGVKNHFGFYVPTLVKTRENLKTIIDSCPFPEDKKVSSYFALFSNKPDEGLVEIASQKTYPNEEFKIAKDCIYFFCANGYGKAKFNLNFFERKLKVNATARNYKTMVKLLSLSEN